MERIKLADNLSLSKLVHGHWRINDWKLASKELLSLVESCVDLGITSFDHADIYGNYTCEGLFGEALALKPELRNHLQIITKCGIKLISDKYPNRTVKHYDYSYNHIISSVENSLKEFQTDRIDLLLLHRPSPFFKPEEIAKAFEYLQHSGKALQFGVSNFNPIQIELLQDSIDMSLVTNQIEISPFCIDSFENQTIDYGMLKGIVPMAWSPLAGGKLFQPETDKAKRLSIVLKKVAAELDVQTIDKVMLAWLLKHPSGIVPILGSGNLTRINSAVEAMEIQMTLEQWFEIYASALGKSVP